ncbi:sodium-dependent transporter [Thalassotalea ponticola]|uniref:sodium-dependent transporter n=1 Tax=Thalassotalea ponticola TaxID=1523392 RepID=UPI0025B521B8|nr:sodium-dependent transporter [Thalassotalea ponticola]MDN3652002.1 sodium-dependent transporter [Thalassotalea ponticola]
MSAPREHFSSKLGFILAAAGSAVGIGNIVGFPVNAAKNGGGAFLLMYAIFVFAICLPIMMAEMAVGRKAAKNPVGAYKALAGENSKWGLAGLLGIITPFMIAVFYTVLTVWIFIYLVMTVTGQLDYLASSQGFGEIINNPYYLFSAMIVVGGLIAVILNFGVKDGIERAARIMMPALFVMLVLLVIFVLTLDNAMSGLQFYLIPDVEKITPAVISGALSQAFFSLSLGMGILITYGSYISKQTDIEGSAKLVAMCDTSVAFIAGLMVLPAIFSFNPNVNPDELSDSSVSMIFVFLPKIFLALQTSVGYFAASAIAGVFFLLVFFAALTSLVSIIEVPVSYFIDERKQSRKGALKTVFISGAVLAVLSSLSFGLSDTLTNLVEYGGKNKSLFDLIIDMFYDTILPLNGLLICLFVTYRWKKHNLNLELSEGNKNFGKSFLAKYVDFSLGTFIPVILALIFINTVAKIYFGYNFFG